MMETGSSATSSWQPPPPSPSSVRFSQTPPDSPKSCMKGSRRLNFVEPGESSTSATDTSWRNQTSSGGADSPSYSSSSPRSPRKTPKTVMIKSPGSGVQMTPTGIIGTSEDEGSSSSPAKLIEQEDEANSEVQFQFHLSQHYERSPTPPNCTSNGSYDEYLRKKEEHSNSQCDKETPSFTFDTSEIAQRDLKQYDPQLVEIATRFVNEIIEKAKLEVVNRQKAESKRTSFSQVVDRGRELLRMSSLGNVQPSNWYRRAHGTVSKWVTNICVRAQNAVVKT